MTGNNETGLCLFYFIVFTFILSQTTDSFKQLPISHVI